MAFVRRWWGWAVFAALLVGVGAALHAVLPVLPKLRLEGRMPVGVTDDGATLFTVDVAPAGSSVVGPLRVWDTASGKLLRSVAHDLHWDDQRYNEQFSPDRNWMVYSTEKGMANLVDLRTGGATVLDLNDMVRNTTKKPTARAYQFRSSFYSQSRYVCLLGGTAVNCADFLVVVELSSGKVVHRTVVESFNGLMGDPPVCVYYDEERSICSFNLETGDLKRLPDKWNYLLATSPDRTLIAVVHAFDGRGGIEIRDVATHAVKHHLPMKGDWLQIVSSLRVYHRACFSPDNRLLLVDRNWYAKLDAWDVATGELRFTIPSGSRSYLQKCVSPDGRWIAVTEPGGEDKIAFFDLRSGEKKGGTDIDVVHGEQELGFLDNRRFGQMEPLFASRRLSGGDIERFRIIGLSPDRDGAEFARVIAQKSGDRKSHWWWASENRNLAVKAIASDPKTRPARWIEQAKRKLQEWVPALATPEGCEITAFDLKTGEELGGVRHQSVHACIFAEGTPTLVTAHGGEFDLARCACVWDLPLRKPWRWVVGVPLALGAALLGVRWAWRRWRAKPVAG